MIGDSSAPLERFSLRAQSYDVGRPRYPAALFDWYRDRFHLTEESVVADIGAGTGLHTEGLADLAGLVWAVEPNGDMRARAEERFAGRDDVRVVAGAAEASGIPRGSVDLVTAAQAFHWFDPEGFSAEVDGMLARPGAWALVWNVRDPGANPFTAGYEAILHRWGRGYGDIRASWANPETIARFSDLATEQHVFENVLTLDAEGAHANLASCSFMPAPGSPEAHQAQEALDHLFEEQAREGTVDLVYRTVAIAPAEAF